MGCVTTLYNHHKELFLRKSKDWETEWEYRWLVHNETNKPEYVDIEGVILEVIIGVNFPDVYKPSLIEVSKKLNISASGMSWNNRIPVIHSGSIYKPTA